ncbi:MAG TPA: efflux RND transporter periplasmic adaptor subunit [Vicinamibacterales bacterium]|nr:efflux RND transporter periplasmic adaptor subunit [Vicinamibacterales bacterium]HPW19264.1 efflux RND transporter periplasmic adaptor subunit [Vicinamibacterales bacterium]
MSTRSLVRTLFSVLGWIALAAVAVAGAWMFARTWQRAAQPAPDVLQGQIEAAEIDVSSKIPGRIDSIAVAEGANVRKGDLVATLRSPELEAKLAQARAARAAAAAQHAKAERGAREEEIRAAEASLQRAHDAAVLAETTFRRVERLTRDGVTAAQRRDEAETVWKSARSAEEAARALYDMAARGPRAEDKDAAAAMVGAADGAIAEVQAYLKETSVYAPAAGQVYRRNLEPGEMVSAGLPIATLVDLDDVWAVFHVREDKLAGLAPGSAIDVSIPALGNRRAAFRVSYLAPEADYATWRPTSAQGGFDVKTFEVRARPVERVEGLRPGMSAVISGR